jgi:hypothetical protein
VLNCTVQMLEELEYLVQKRHNIWSYEYFRKEIWAWSKLPQVNVSYDKSPQIQIRALILRITPVLGTNLKSKCILVWCICTVNLKTKFGLSVILLSLFILKELKLTNNCWEAIYLYIFMTNLFPGRWRWSGHGYIPLD